MQKKNYTTLRLGKNNKFLINMFGISLEKNLDQFVLKVENKGEYNKIGTEKYKNHYDMYIKPDLIMNENKGYAYICYKGDILPFQQAYERALVLQSEYVKKYGKYINIFCYGDYCYLLESRYKNPARRPAFKDIELQEAQKKYTYGIKRGAKRGAEKAQSITKKILSTMGV